jgi:hypothetical protein
VLPTALAQFIHVAKTYHTAPAFPTGILAKTEKTGAIRTRERHNRIPSAGPQNPRKPMAERYGRPAQPARLSFSLPKTGAAGNFLIERPESRTRRDGPLLTP